MSLMNQFSRDNFARLSKAPLSTWIIISFVLVAGIFPSSIKNVSAATSQMPLAVDGFTRTSCPNTTSFCTTSLSTSHQNDIIIVFAVETLDLQSSCQFNVSDTAALFWAARSGIVFSADGRSQFQEFWARSASPLSSDAITESIINCGTNYNTVVVFGISGANFVEPFDPNNALPGTASDSSGNTSVQVSTSNANDMIFAGVTHGDNCCFPTAGPGFSLIPFGPGNEQVEYKVVNATVSNTAVTFNDTAVAPWLSIGDAVQALSTTPDFSVLASPTNLILIPGSVGRSMITLFSFNDFSGTIALSATVSPQTFSGPSVDLNPVSVFLSANGTASSLLTIRTLNSTQPGTYAVTVGGSNGTVTRSAVVSVLVPTPAPPDFSMSASTPFVLLQSGTSVNDTITLAGFNGFSGDITLNLVVFGPGGLTATTTPSVISLVPNVNETSTLTLYAGFPPYTPADFSVTVTGMSGSISRSVSVSVTVLPPPPPPPDFSINVFPGSLTMIAGETQTAGISLLSVGGFSGTIRLNASVSPTQPNGPSVSVNPTVVQLPQNGIIFPPESTLTISTTTLTPPGNYSVSVGGSSGTLSHFGTVSIMVLPPPTITVNPTRGTPGTEVNVTGGGFPTPQGQFPFPVTIEVTFDDQFVGFTTTTNGAFQFTFNIPLAQPGQHMVKATTSFPTLTATTSFTVLQNPSSIIVNLTTGAIYFPGDTAVIYITTTGAGTPVGPANLQMQVTLIAPNGTMIILTANSIGPGLYKSNYAVGSKATIGTYAIQVKAHETGFLDGSALSSFEVKPTWISSNGQGILMTATLLGALGTVAVGIVARQKGYFGRRIENAPTLSFSV